jgi:hypothetical protein
VHGLGSLESKAEADLSARHSANKDCSFYSLNFGTLNHADIVASSCLMGPEPRASWTKSVPLGLGSCAYGAILDQDICAGQVLGRKDPPW